MMYSLHMSMPDDINLEGIACALERAANQVRQMSSTAAAHSMQFRMLDAAVTGSHGVARTSGVGTPG
jgi:hypothetical protein